MIIYMNSDIIYDMRIKLSHMLTNQLKDVPVNLSETLANNLIDAQLALAPYARWQTIGASPENVNDDLVDRAHIHFLTFTEHSISQQVQHIVSRYIYVPSSWDANNVTMSITKGNHYYDEAVDLIKGPHDARRELFDRRSEITANFEQYLYKFKTVNRLIRKHPNYAVLLPSLIKDQLDQKKQTCAQLAETHKQTLQDVDVAIVRHTLEV